MPARRSPAHYAHRVGILACVLSILTVVLANWVPDPNPDFGSDPTPFVMTMLAGFVIGMLGHLFRSRILILVGVLAVFAGTVLLPLAVYVSKS